METSTNIFECIQVENESTFPFSPKRGLPYAMFDVDGCAFKKCCKKYKRGKRCKKCPDK